MVAYPTDRVAVLVREMVTSSAPMDPHPTGRVADNGPLEDLIQPSDIRIRGRGAEAEVEIVFKHRAYPELLFGLRSGPLWTSGDDGEPWFDPDDVEDAAAYLSSWAQDYAFLRGLPSEKPASDDGVIWVDKSFRGERS
jgi:hypothetical protein